MAAIINQAKRRLADGELALGFILRQARTADIAAIGSSCGFDWLSIDMEHSSIGMETAAQIASAGLGSGITVLVRMPAPLYPDAARLLDAGAQGVIVPHVETADDARFVVSFSKYPPLGNRSIGAAQPQLRFASVAAAEAMELVNGQMLVVAMLETEAAIANCEAIAAVPGIDVLLIGTNDLLSDMGIPGQFAHPRLEAAHREIAAASKRHGIFAGTSGIHDPAILRNYVGFGIRFLGGGTDLSFLMTAARERSRALRQLLGP
jgi:2-keto-3-deoxy-L-rhamnonate aldolase RhmA